MEHFTEEQRKKISNQALAIKYKVTTKYVQKLLSGKSPQNTDTAKAIVADAKAILRILDNNLTSSN